MFRAALTGMAAAAALNVVAACGSTDGTRTGFSDPPPVQDPAPNPNQPIPNPNDPVDEAEQPAPPSQALPTSTAQPATPPEVTPAAVRCGDICRVLSGSCVSLTGITGRCAGVVNSFLTCAVRAGFLCNGSGRIDPQNVTQCVDAASNIGNCLGNIVDDRGGNSGPGGN